MNKALSFSFLFLFFLSCRQKPAETPQALAFEAVKWKERSADGHPWRNAMLDDLLQNVKLHGLHYDSVRQLLGPPDREDKGHLFYRLSEKRWNNMVLHARTLVIKLRPDSTVEWRKIHQ